MAFYFIGSKDDFQRAQIFTNSKGQILKNLLFYPALKIMNSSKNIWLMSEEESNLFWELLGNNIEKIIRSFICANFVFDSKSLKLDILDKGHYGFNDEEFEGHIVYKPEHPTNDYTLSLVGCSYQWTLALWGENWSQDFIPSFKKYLINLEKGPITP